MEDIVWITLSKISQLVHVIAVTIAALHLAQITNLTWESLQLHVCKQPGLSFMYSLAQRKLCQICNFMYRGTFFLHMLKRFTPDALAIKLYQLLVDAHCYV